MLGERGNESEDFKMPSTTAKTRMLMSVNSYCILIVGLITVCVMGTSLFYVSGAQRRLLMNFAG